MPSRSLWPHGNVTRWLDRNIWLVSSHVENGFLSQFDTRVVRMVSYQQSFTVHAMHTSLCNGDHIISKESFHPILRKSFLWVTHTCVGNLSHNSFENPIYEMAVILSRTQCVNSTCRERTQWAQSYCTLIVYIYIYVYIFTYRVNPKLYFMKENIKKNNAQCNRNMERSVATLVSISEPNMKFRLSGYAIANPSIYHIHHRKL